MNLKTKLEEMRKRCEGAIELDWEPNPNKKLRAQDNAVQHMPALISALEVCLGALEVCARPGTYHLVGDVQEQGNYAARNALASAEKIIGGGV